MLDWDPCTGTVLGYRVYYSKTNTNFDNFYDVGDLTRYPISNLPLEKNAIYYFYVTGYNDAGEGTPSNIISIVTDNNPPLEQFEYDFSSDSLAGWTEVNFRNPCLWAITDGFLTQTENEPGALIYENLKLSDYSFRVDVRSQDDDGIGVIFRYVNDKNYYRFSLNDEQYKRRLEKIVNDQVFVLYEASVGYNRNQWYHINFTLNGANITLYLDHELLFDIEDDTFLSGKFGFYSLFNIGSEYDNLVIDFKPNQVMEDFSNVDLGGWERIDFDGTTEWHVLDERLIQITSNKGALIYDGMILHNFSLNTDIRSQDNDLVGIIFRYVDKHNFYLFTLNDQRTRCRLEKYEALQSTVLAEEKIGYLKNKWYQVSIEGVDENIKIYLDDVLLFDIHDNAFFNGKIGLYSGYNQGSEFDNVAIKMLK